MEFTMETIKALVGSAEGMRMIRQAMAEDGRRWVVASIEGSFDDTYFSVKENLGMTEISKYSGADTLAIGEYLYTNDYLIFRTK